MRSSASTRSPPETPIGLGIVVVGDDHPRACTGRRLIRLGLARSRRDGAAGSERSVILDPYADRPLTSADRPRAERHGIVAIDCSWNRLSSSQARGSPSQRGPGSRRLPMLVATNPQHYGRWGELNTAEALAAALYLLGAPAAAGGLLAGFAGGPAFLEVNRRRLDRYAGAGSIEVLYAAERELLGGG